MRGSWVEDWTTRISENSLLRRRPLPAILVSAALVALAVGIRLAAGDWLHGVPFLTLFSCVALSAFIGGWKVGLFATVLGGVAATFFILPPIDVSAIRTASDVAALAGYAITCAVIVLIIHIAIRAAETNVALAAQRQVLLMELHHRIKNHLQLLGAMIATHARATTNDKVRARLEEAGRRLQVIASTYNNLYEPGAVIDMADHLRKVCAFVEGGVASSNTRISVDSVQTKWPVDRVVPLSLIANELLTNAVKHAPPDQDLAIEVSLQRVGDLMRFSVLTKNVKLPADFDAANSGLGLRLASMLGKQLGGTLTTHACPMRCSCSSFRSDREFIERCEHTFGGVAEELSVGRCPLATQPVQLGQQRLVDRLEPLPEERALFEADRWGMPRSQRPYQLQKAVASTFGGMRWAMRSRAHLA